MGRTLSDQGRAHMFIRILEKFSTTDNKCCSIWACSGLTRLAISNLGGSRLTKGLQFTRA